jgi:hypothetical protein
MPDPLPLPVFPAASRKWRPLPPPQFLPLALTLLRPRVSRALLRSTYDICAPQRLKPLKPHRTSLKGAVVHSLLVSTAPPLSVLIPPAPHLLLPCSKLHGRSAVIGDHCQLSTVERRHCAELSHHLNVAEPPGELCRPPCCPAVSPCAAEPCATDRAHRGLPRSHRWPRHRVGHRHGDRTSRVRLAPLARPARPTGPAEWATCLARGQRGLRC